MCEGSVVLPHHRARLGRAAGWVLGEKQDVRLTKPSVPGQGLGIHHHTLTGE